MNNLVQSNIDSRKSAIFNGYDISDKDILNQIEDLFNRINEFGNSCIDPTDFETKFATSPLNQEYIELFTKIATTCNAKTIEDNNVIPQKSLSQDIFDEIGSEVRYRIDDATQPMRRKANQEAFDKARDIPVIKDILNVNQHIDLFNKFKK